MSKLTDALSALTGSALSGLATRLDSFVTDGWVNPVTGFGTTRDKTTYTEFSSFDRLTDIELSNLYHGDDMAARIVDIVPQEMLREGFQVDVGTAEDNTVIGEKFDDLGVTGKFADAIRWGRLYGGGAVLIGCDDLQEATTPLRPERAEDIKYLYVLDRRNLWPNSWYSEPGHPKLGMPETYSVISSTVGGVGAYTAIVHESRLILFHGSPTGIRERAQFAGWDMSVLQRPHEILRSFNTGWKAVEILLTDGNQPIFKMSGLAEMIAGNNEAALRTRLNIVDMYRSVLRAIVIDAEGNEEFSRNTVSFSDIPATLDKYMLRLAAAAQMPVTILMGQSPAGMNATGESDFRWFYDRIRSEQTMMLAPKIRKLVNTWLQTKAGRAAIKKNPERVLITFPPLWTEPPMEEATRKKMIVDTDALLIQSGVYLPEEVALVRGRPDGYKVEIQLSDEAIKAREGILKMDLEKLEAGEQVGSAIVGESTGDEAPPEGVAPELENGTTDHVLPNGEDE